MPTFYGTAYADTIFGSNYADTIYGRGGADWINGGLGADYLYGDAGDDVFWWDIVDTGSGSRPYGFIDGGLGYDLIDLSNIADSGLVYTDGDAYVRVGAQTYDFTRVEEIWLGDGANRLAGTLGITAATSPLAIFFGGGNDTATLDGAITVNGEEGNDIFTLIGVVNAGFTLSSTVYGGTGTDTIRVGDGFSVDLFEGTASSGDSIYYLDSIENVIATARADSTLSTIVDGDDFANRMTVGTDTSTAADIGVDFFGYGGNDYLSGSNAQDLLEGGAGNDQLLGRGGNDTLRGGDGADRLFGDAGSDYLHGGTGRDTLTGGSGADDFVFLALTDTARTSAGADVIADFRHSDFDLIDLSAIDANSGTAANDAFRFIGTGAFSGARGELRSTYEASSGSTLVQGDVNGDGIADFMIRLTGQHTLVADDFVL